MPQNALIASYDAIEMGCGGEFSYPSGPYGSGTFGAHFEALYAPDVYNLAASVAIEIGWDSDGNHWYAGYDGPNAPAGGYSLSGVGKPGNLSLYARYLNVKIYTRFTQANVRFTWTAIEIRVNGVLVVTLGGGQRDSAGMGPLYIQPHSGLAVIGGGAGVEASEPNNPGPDGSYSNSGTVEMGGTVVGGYRYLIDGEWKDLPVTIPGSTYAPPTTATGFGDPNNPPTVDAPYGLTFGDTIKATRTWGGQIRSRARKDYAHAGDGHGYYYSYLLTEEQSGELTIVPNTPRALRRINPDFAASVWHWASPLVGGIAQRPMSVQYVAATGRIEPILYQHRNAGSEELGNAGGVADQMLALSALSGIFTTHNKLLNESGSAIPNNVREERLVASLPDFNGGRVEANTTPYLMHYEPLGRYFASAIVHPFWSLGYVPGNWNLQGSPVRWALTLDDMESPAYWGYAREQYLAGQQRRNHIVSCPLEVSGWQQFLDAYNRTSNETSGKRWIGVSRWLTQKVDPPSDVQTDATGSSSWSPIEETCELSFGASGVTVTGAAGALCKVRLNVGRFNVHPYLYPMICDRATLGWNAAGVGSVRAFAATGFGDRKQIAPLTNGAVAHIPRGKSSKYAGSWGYDNGIGQAYDQGSDSKPQGVSAALSYDPEESLMYRLLEAGSPGYLEFDVQLAPGATSATLHWPRWHRAEGARHLEAENGMVQSLVYADGPGIRVGNQTWWDEILGLVNPPETRGLGGKWNLLDWLCFKRLCLQAQPFTGGPVSLATELTQIFDAFEVQSVGAAAFGTLAFVLPSDGPEWIVACVHAVGEIPPLAAFPSFSRKTDWTKDAWGDAGAWAWAQGPRRIVAAGTTPMHLHKPDGTQVTVAIAAPAGWSITEHSAVVTNAETPNWLLKCGGSEWGKATPWHGLFWVGGIGAGDGSSPPSYDVDHSSGFHVLSTIEDDELVIRTADPSLAWTVRETGVAAKWACVRIDRSREEQRLFVALQTPEDAIAVYESDDDGANWTMATNYGPGKMPAIAIGRDGLRYCYWLRGTSVIGRVADPAGTDLEGEFTARSGVDEDGGVAAGESVRGAERRLHLAAVVDGNVIEWDSTDGVEFE